MGLSDLSAAAETVGADVIQLHGAESPEMVECLGNAGPWKVWKAIRVRTSEDVREAVTKYSGVAQGIVLDGWHPGKLGGTGAPFSWEEVSRIRDDLPPELELVVAGGLRPENVQEVILRFRPQIVDVSSGVEVEPGIKDRNRVEAFISRVRRGRRGEGA
jgi:phosphoribosylanthranilate isomerase